MGGMSRRQYRRNGTPIGKHDVYALAFNRGEMTQVFEILPQGIETYEDLESLVMLEMIEGKFGAPERLVITKPGVDLSGLNLFGAYMFKADLRGANIELSYLAGVCLDDAILVGATLRGAELYEAELREANLENADLRESGLVMADLRGSNLKGAKLLGCKWDSTTRWPRGFDPPPSR